MKRQLGITLFFFFFLLSFSFGVCLCGMTAYIPKKIGFPIRSETRNF